MILVMGIFWGLCSIKQRIILVDHGEQRQIIYTKILKCMLWRCMIEAHKRELQHNTIAHNLYSQCNLKDIIDVTEGYLWHTWHWKSSQERWFRTRIDTWRRTSRIGNSLLCGRNKVKIGCYSKKCMHHILLKLLSLPCPGDCKINPLLLSGWIMCWSWIQWIIF